MTVDVHMRETDAFSWSMESDPRMRMLVVSIALLDGVPDWAETVRRMEALTRAAPMFRQRLVMPPVGLAPPKWVVDERFDLGWHLRRVVAPSPATLDTVLDFAARLGSCGFDLSRPLWESWLVEGLDGGRSAVVTKVHHTLTDGLGGMQLLARMFDVDGIPLAHEPAPPAPPAGDASALALLRSGLAHDARQLVSAARGGVRGLAQTLAEARHEPLHAVEGALATWLSVIEMVAPSGGELSPVMTRRGLARRYAVLDVPLEELRAAGRVVDGTVNDAYLTAITGGLRRYHAAHDAAVPELRVTLPVNVRRPEDPIAGNRMALVRYRLPLEPADPVQRMREVQARTRRWKEAPALPYTEAAYSVVNWLPTGYLQQIVRSVDFVASNVPGFRTPVRLAGPALLAYYPFGPTGGTAVNVTMMSCNSTGHVGVNLDTDAVPDAETFLACLQDGFDEVRGLPAARRTRRRVRGGDDLRSGARRVPTAG